MKKTTQQATHPDLQAGVSQAQVLEVDLSAWMSSSRPASLTHAPSHVPSELKAQPQELVFSASRKIVLQCGLSSITLHANGKVELRGQSIVSAAEGINRLSGGQIEIN
jgi:hypothetical protein